MAINKDILFTFLYVNFRISSHLLAFLALISRNLLLVILDELLIYFAFSRTDCIVLAAHFACRNTSTILARPSPVISRK